MNKEKPKFLPLKRKFYNQFKDGSKTEEYRKYGRWWNERTCTVGREVVLSLGYGKERMRGIITGFRVERNTELITGWSDCYGESDAVAACIEIKIQP